MTGDTVMTRAQMRWRCRRGMRELDLLMSRWLEERYAAATPEQQAGFRRLLEAPDPDLYGWMIGRERPDDPVLARLVDAIRET